MRRPAGFPALALGTSLVLQCWPTDGAAARSSQLRVSGPAGSTIAPELRAVLSTGLKFTAVELGELERGRTVRHGLGASAPSEVAVAGATRVTARSETFVDRVRDIEDFKRGPDVLQIGRFSDPPRLDDLAPLTIGREDLDLRRCRVGACDIRLPAAVIGRFQREIDWGAPEADARAGALFKQVLFDNVQAYLTGGPGRMTEYDDEKRPVRPVDDFAAILQSSPYIGSLVPGLPDHLLDPTAHPLAGIEDFLYWSKEKFGLTPFITVTHVSIARAAFGSDIIVSNDVYSTRYFDASVSLTIASDVMQPGGAGGSAGAGGAADHGAFYLVYANRSRAYALKGPLASVRRAIIERRAKSSLEENLRMMKQRLERQ
jgi:hypothetical protein